MLNLVFVVMFQATAGQPQAAPAEAAPALAEEQAQQTEETQDSVARRQERHRITCRNQTVIGSRMTQRVCMSQADREAQQQETQRIADEMHRSGPLNGN